MLSSLKFSRWAYSRSAQLNRACSASTRSRQSGGVHGGQGTQGARSKEIWYQPSELSNVESADGGRTEQVVLTSAVDSGTIVLSVIRSDSSTILKVSWGIGVIYL